MLSKKFGCCIGGQESKIYGVILEVDVDFLYTGRYLKCIDRYLVCEYFKVRLNKLTF